MSNIIGNKIFAYIDNHNQLTASMIEQYKNAIIVLGDEKQAYIPILSSYIGVSQSYVNSLSERINNTNNSLDEYNNFIHNDVVTSIYAQFTPEELKSYSNGVDRQLRGLTINNDTAYTAFRTKRDIIIKGLNNNNELDSSSFTAINSGINVTLNRGLEEKSGTTTINGKQYNFSYYVPYDVLNIDDTYTFSYIENSNSYIIQFVADFASQQADRVYKNLLGENSTIYIEKEFGEAFIKETGTLKEIREVYVKVQGNNGNPDENGYARITIDDNNNIKFKSGNTIIKNADGTTPSGIENILASIGGYDELIDGNGHTIYEPIWYHRDKNNTSTYNMSINDGIETLKEVAYILDQITNGDDSGINLAYNISYNYIEIQKLKEWQNGIGNETVSAFKSESNNELLTVNYYSHNLYGDKDSDNEGFSTGKVKLDLNLVLAQTYILNDVTYAAYLSNHAGANKTYYKINNDPTNADNYKQVSLEIFNFIKTADPSKTIYYYNKVGNYFEKTTETATAQNIGSHTNQYLYCPYELAQYDFTKGLTTVKWVTSYVREVYNDLSYRINSIDVTGDILREIAKLDNTSYINKSNQGIFVSNVSEIDGIISVEQNKLPLDYIIHNDIISNEDIYLNLTFLDAKSHKDSGNIYRLVNNNYTLINSNDNIWTNGDNLKYDNLYYKINISSMVQVATNISYLNLINNAGNTSYFFKDDTTNKTIYTPIDIQEMNTSSNLSSYIGNGKIYYWDKAGARIKYFDAHTIQNYDGSTTTTINSYITTLSMASPTNSGLADAWDVRHTIENMFKWVDIKTNKIIG